MQEAAVAWRSCRGIPDSCCGTFVPTEANGHTSSGASAADAASAGCAHQAPQQRPPLPPAEKVACGVREDHPDKAEEVLESMTTLIKQSLGPWIHLQTALVESARARLQNTASPQLLFVVVDGKSAEINGIIASTQPDRSKGTRNLVLLWAQTRRNATYSKKVITQSDVSEETPAASFISICELVCRRPAGRACTCQPCTY